MLTAAEAKIKYETSIEDKIGSEIERACKNLLKSVEMVFYGEDMIDYIEKIIIPKLMEAGYKVDAAANRFGGILTSTSSSGDANISLTISW